MKINVAYKNDTGGFVATIISDKGEPTDWLYVGRSPQEAIASLVYFCANDYGPITISGVTMDADSMKAWNHQERVKP